MNQITITGISEGNKKTKCLYNQNNLEKEKQCWLEASLLLT